MIDLEREELITIGQATRYIPKRREGRKVAAKTVWRWIVFGHRGIRLDGMRTPSGWCTTVQAIQRFLSELAKLDIAEMNRDLWQEVARKKAATAYLDAAGIGVSKQEFAAKHATNGKHKGEGSK